MRLGIAIAAVSLLLAQPALADHLVIPNEDDPAAIRYDMTERDQTQPFDQQRPDPALTEQPIAEVIAAKLGVAQGSFQLFRYQVENAPSSSTVMRAVLDGGGLKFKVTW
jgi:hypothetical protein